MSCNRESDTAIFGRAAELDDTLSIFLVPFGRQSAPKDDLLEHYLSMRLSRCYLKSGGRLGCITCHNPHMQPSQQEAPAYFRQKCLACHTDKSCALPLSLRQHKTPPDDCAGCHMPKRDVTVISHSVLTNHRIVAEAEEPFPDVAFRMTTLQLRDLVQLTANPAKQGPPPALTLLRAYGQVMLAHPEYRERYWAMAKQLKTTQPKNVDVLEALADETSQYKNAESAALTIGYLEDAIVQGATNPADFEELAELLVTANRQTDALHILQQGRGLNPYDAELFRLSAKIYFALNRMREACEVAAQGSQKFPQDDAIRSFRKRCDTASAGMSD